MRKAFEAILSALTLAVALALVAGIFWLAIRWHSSKWQAVAARYLGGGSSPAIARKLEVAIFAARDIGKPDPSRSPAFRKYAGLVISVHHEGMALSLVPPFNILCPPLFLPFNEMALKPTDWALWCDPYAIRMGQLPDIDIIVGRETMRWLREHVDRAPFGLD